MLEQGSLAVTCTKDHIVGDGVITMTTAKGIGDAIRLAYIADGDVSIEGAEGTPRSERYINYTLTSQQVTMRGDITILDCKANRLTDIDVSHCSSLKVLYCFANEIKGKSMLQLVNSLPDRTGLESGAIIIYSDGSFGPEDNVCLKSDVAIARAKNWGVGLARVENRELKPYRYDGEDPTKTFAVTLTQGDNGTISATGADDLHAVLEGTELTITDSPKKGYELTALTANGEDILATKKLNVREDTEIKATFAKKSYTVTFTKEGKGNLTATKNGESFTSGSPAHEGDKIVITAQPAEGYQIDKWLIGKEEMEFTPYTGKTTFECTVGTTDVLIKATFAKKTYPVTLTYNEHGTISIVEPVDLEAVPYGTTLTVKATGKNAQCELTALTANGKDILSTKQFTVQGATKVQATFVDRTSVETIRGHALRIYPNPAQTFVLIGGLQPASQVSLYSMNGKQLYTGQTDQQGALQIDLTALSDGVYLLVGEGWQKRLVVKQ